MAEDPSMENGETPRKKVRRRVGACPEFIKLAQKRKGKTEVIQLLLLFHATVANNFSFEHQPGYFARPFSGLIVHCGKPRRR